MERTLVLLKPDCIQRRLAGRVITRLENKGLNIVAMKLLRVTPNCPSNITPNTSTSRSTQAWRSS